MPPGYYMWWWNHGTTIDWSSVSAVVLAPLGYTSRSSHEYECEPEDDLTTQSVMWQVKRTVSRIECFLSHASRSRHSTFQCKLREGLRKTRQRQQHTFFSSYSLEAIRIKLRVPATRTVPRTVDI